MGGKTDKKLIVNGKRVDGRGIMDIRPLNIQAGVLERADGSCLLEWGRNRVLASVYGPREVFPKHMTDPTKCVIRFRYSMAPFSNIDEHSRAGQNRRSQEISKIARHVFENVVLVEQFPKTMIDVVTEVLQSDGGTRIAAITAASVALVDAGIPCKDLVCGVSVGRINGELVVDVDKYEDNFGESDIPFVFSPRTGEILLFQADGMLTKKELVTAREWAWEASKKVHAKQVEALHKRYADHPAEPAWG
jgi:exosome complex component RRP41